jgi:hypothetical protein
VRVIVGWGAHRQRCAYTIQGRSGRNCRRGIDAPRPRSPRAPGSIPIPIPLPFPIGMAGGPDAVVIHHRGTETRSHRRSEPSHRRNRTRMSADPSHSIRAVALIADIANTKAQRHKDSELVRFRTDQARDFNTEAQRHRGTQRHRIPEPSQASQSRRLKDTKTSHITTEKPQITRMEADIVTGFILD